MRNNEIINGISAVVGAVNAFQSINKDVLDPIEFEKAACDFIGMICCENPALTSARCLDNESNGEGQSIGRIHFSMNSTDNISTMLKKQTSCFANENVIDVSAKLNFAKPFSMLFLSQSDTTIASLVSQQILLAMLEQKKTCNFRCADFVSGGNFFGAVHRLVSLFPEKTGGKVYTKQNEFSELLTVLESAASSAMMKLGGVYASVEDYNNKNDVKIPEYLTIIYLNAASCRNEDYDRLHILAKNGKRNGLSFIFVGESENVSFCMDCVDFEFDCLKDQVSIGHDAKLPFAFEEILEISDQEIANIISSLQTLEAIDTHYENHPELHTDFFTMDSVRALRIPFAIDKNNRLLYFEIGGNAPTHALIAGSTGSGKTAALHTLIMQIVHNYHPDDVEIWAIDYKAVEFDKYIDHHTPHFRVIAHDTSKEFSLSLIDLLYKEYEKRQQDFLNARVKSINEYRQVCGKRSMPRIIVIIDEFQLMTQAVQEYTGNIDYRTRLENLLRLTRAMGISFVLCSQTIASGLSGLSDAARDQIGCRLCLKHEDDNEIRETLMLSGSNASDIAAKAKELRCGQGIYKRARWADEHASDGKAYEFLKAYIIFFNEELKNKMIVKANAFLQNNYTPKEEVLVRGGGRITIANKVRHPLVRFMNHEYEPDEECMEWYPAAPTTLADAFCVKIENTASANIMFVGEDDDLRESVVIHSVCGFLMNPNNMVVVCIADENYPDRARIIRWLRKIQSERLVMNIGIRSCVDTIAGLKKIRPTFGKNTIYIWYGLDKIKNELFLMKQDEEEDVTSGTPDASMSRDDMIADLMGFLSDITGVDTARAAEKSSGDELSFEDCKTILRQAFEVGPENNKFHMVIFNNRKAMKKSGMIEMDSFDNRIGTRMSTDDSYELFGTSLAVSKTDENTVVYYAGSGNVIPLRPYLMPDEQWFNAFNQVIDNQ